MTRYLTADDLKKSVDPGIPVLGSKYYCHVHESRLSTLDPDGIKDGQGD
jgi:hypothetical protein